MAKDKIEDKNENVVIGIFESQEAADQAIEGLKAWDKINEKISLGIIGTITKDGDKVKTHVARKVGKGAKVGAVVGIIGAVLTGGVLIAGAIGAGALGGALGSFFKKSLNLTKDEIAQIGAELDAGKVAVVVTCDEHEIESVTSYLTSPTSTVRTYRVPDEALEEAAASPEVMEPVSEGQV